MRSQIGGISTRRYTPLPRMSVSSAPRYLRLVLVSPSLSNYLDFVAVAFGLTCAPIDATLRLCDQNATGGLIIGRVFGNFVYPLALKRTS